MKKDLKARSLRLIGATICLSCFSFSAANIVEAKPPAASDTAGSYAASDGEIITIQIPEAFFNRILETIFARLSPPTFPLSLGHHATNSTAFGFRRVECLSRIALTREIDGTRTAVKFGDGKITAPLAFYGSYRVGLIGGCVNFSGWAETDINLDFDRQRQTLNARVTVRNIRLRGVPSLAGGVIVQLVQDALDEKINPVEVLKAEQLTTAFPVTGTNGALKLTAQKITPEISNGVLRLQIEYAFAGQPR